MSGRRLSSRRWTVLAGALLAIAGGLMLWLTWGFWADPIFASGRELYLAWQLSAGKVLYRDVAHNNGPLSAYFNATLFKAFSPRVHMLVFANLFLLAGMVAMVWRLWVMIADRLAAFVACLLLLLLFAFVQFTGTGGFNFMLPYEHEMTHGLILSFAAIVCLAEYARRRGDNAGWIVTAGIALGLISLTKATLFIAAFVPVACGAGSAMYAHRLRPRQIASHLVLLIGATVFVPLLAVGWMSGSIPSRDAIAAVISSWRWTVDDQLFLMYHTQVWLGLDVTSHNVDRIIVSCFIYAIILGPALGLGMLLRKKGEVRIVAVAGTIFVVFSAFYILYDRINWQYDPPAGLTLAIFGLTVALVTVLLQRHRDRIDAVLIIRLTICWFAFLLLIQLGLRAVIFEYGFVLALPATLIGAAATVSWLPRLADRAGGFGWVPRAAALTAISVLLFNHLSHEIRSIPRHPIVIGEGIDAMRFDARGGALSETLAELRARSSPRDTLLVLPEGAMLNFLSGLANPTPFPNLMPVEMMKFGPENVLAAIQRSPPDWIAISTVSTEAFGSKSFAEGYGRDVWDWLEPRYEPVATHGNQSFFMRLYRKRANP